MRTVTHNTLFLTGASIIQKALSFIYFTLLARTFTADQIGAYSYSLAFTTIFSIIVDGGLTPVLIRYTARHQGQTNSLLKRILQFKSALLVASLLAMTFAVLHIDAALSTHQLIIAAAAVMIVDSLNLSTYGALRGHQNLSYESVGMVVAQIASLSCVIAVVALHLPIIFAILGLGFGSVVNSCIALWGLSRVQQLQGEYQKAELPVRTLVSEAVPFALAGIFARGYSYLDLLILGSYANFAIAGTYSIANKLTFVFQFIPLSLSAALYPAFSKLLGNADQKQARELWHSSERYVLLAAGLIILILISLRVEILGFFGKEHVNATSVLILLAISLAFSFMSYPVGALLNASGLQKLQTIAMGCTLAINACLNVVLIPRFGAIGAAVSALTGNCVLFVVGAWFAERRVVTLPWKRLLYDIILFAMSSAVAGVVITVVRHAGLVSIQHNIIKSLAIIGVYAALGAIVYVGSLFLLGAISRVEIQEFLMRLKKRV